MRSATRKSPTWWRGRKAADVFGRTQVRRPRDQPALRARPVRTRRDTRRRRGGRGRDREPAHDQPDPVEIARQGLAGRARSARRGLHAARRFREIQRDGARIRWQGQAADQPAQRRGRLAAPARSAHHRETAARVLCLCGRRGRGRHAAGDAFADPAQAARLGLPGQPARRHGRGRGRLPRLLSPHRRAARRSTGRAPASTRRWWRSSSPRCSSSSWPASSS